MNINFWPKKCSGQSRYGRYGSYATVHGQIALLVWDTYFHIGMSMLIVNMGKISLFAWDAYFHSGMPIFTVKMGIRMPIVT